MIIPLNDENPPEAEVSSHLAGSEAEAWLDTSARGGVHLQSFCLSLEERTLGDVIHQENRPIPDIPRYSASIPTKNAPFLKLLFHRWSRRPGGPCTCFAGRAHLGLVLRAFVALCPEARRAGMEKLPVQ